MTRPLPGKLIAAEIAPLHFAPGDMAQHLSEVGGDAILYTGMETLPIDTAREDRDWHLAETARRIYKARRSRDLMFGGEGLFADPAWDMMLELFACRTGGQMVSIKRASYAACVPHSTALRWIVKLESVGYLQREADPDDGRRSFVSLTERGAVLMRQALWSYTRPGAMLG